MVTELDEKHPATSVMVKVIAPACKPEALGEVAPELQFYV
jgi:hypothetical protein